MPTFALLRRLIPSSEAVTSIEYAIIAALIAMTIVTIVEQTGEQLRHVFETISTSF